MTFKIKTGYRLNVAMIVLNKENKSLFCKRRNTDNWQFPQGGVDEDETIESAMFRELNEEVGLNEENVEIKAVTQNLIYYDIPKNIRSRVLGGKFKGQAQKYFLLSSFIADRTHLIGYQYIFYYEVFRIVQLSGGFVYGKHQ